MTPEFAALVSQILTLCLQALGPIFGLAIAYYGERLVRQVMQNFLTPEQQRQAEMAVRAAEQLFPGDPDAKYDYAARQLVRKYPALRGQEEVLATLIESTVQGLKDAATRGTAAAPRKRTAAAELPPPEKRRQYSRLGADR